MLIVMVISLTQIWAQQENRNYRIPLIGENAPSFKAESTNGTINFPSDFGNKWKIIISHPMDFTPVCSSEILELSYLQSEFDKLGVQLIIVSTDELNVHKQWKCALESLNYKDRGPTKINFPIVDDKDLNVTRQYGMIQSSSNSTKAVRGVFIIDPNNIVQAIYFYPMNVGRNMDELLRTVTALQATSDGISLTPADWKVGDDFLVKSIPNNETSASDSTYYKYTWYMIYKKGNKS